MEIWRSINGYEGQYEVSNMGRVKSLPREIVRTSHGIMPIRERILKQGEDRYGYLYVTLQDGAKRHHYTVHRLVICSFIGEMKGKQVNHIDGDKTNNKIDNLEWVTAKENIDHAQKLGLRPHYTRGIIRKGIGEDVRYDSIKEAARANKISYAYMFHLLNSSSRTRAGYKFIYESER